MDGLLQVVNQPTAEWKTYAQGNLPPGKFLSVEQVATLRGFQEAPPIYILGKFTVTAMDRNRAVLRPQNANSKGPAARIIVEHPSGSALPLQGSTVIRKSENAFLVREIRRGSDGQLNIFAREIANP